MLKVLAVSVHPIAVRQLGAHLEVQSPARLVRHQRANQLFFADALRRVVQRRAGVREWQRDQPRPREPAADQGHGQRGDQRTAVAQAPGGHLVAVLLPQQPQRRLVVEDRRAGRAVPPARPSAGRQAGR